RFLDAAVRAGLNIVVAGAVGAGKTTLLNCLASAIPGRERVVTCEEVFELRPALPDVVAMQCRQRNLEGEGAVTLHDLVRESLRMRPDRIIVAVADQVSDGEEPTAGAIFTGGGRSLRWTGERPRRTDRFRDRGIDLETVLR